MKTETTRFNVFDAAAKSVVHLDAAAYLEFRQARKSEIASVQVIPPRLGGGRVGATFEVVLKRPRYVVRDL